MIDLYIIGAGSVGGHIASNWDDYNIPYNLKGFLDDDTEKHHKEFCGIPVIGGLEVLKGNPKSSLIIGLAFPSIKLKLLDRIQRLGVFNFPTLISPNAWVSNRVKIGQGSILYPGAMVNYGSTIGDFVVANMNCAFGHDVKIGNYSSFAPGVNLGGFTEIGEGVEMGIGSSTKQFIKIGHYAEVGGQTMVITDVEDNSKVVGVPNRSIGQLISKGFH